MVNYDTLVDREYWDDVAQKMITITIPVRDAVYLDFLKRIERAIKEHG